MLWHKHIQKISLRRFKTAGSIKNNALRNKAFSEIAEILSTQGDSKGVMRAITEIETESFRNKAYQATSKIWADQENYNSALNFAAQINNPYKKATADPVYIKRPKPKKRGTAMIKFEHVGLRYGVGPEILSDITFTLDPGSFHFLSGASGAGKTSLMRLIYLGLKPTRGLISMFNQSIHDLDRRQLSKIRQRIGVVFQEFRLLPHLSVFDNVALPLRIIGASEKETQSNVDELLDWVGLGDYKRVLPITTFWWPTTAGCHCTCSHRSS